MPIITRSQSKKNKIINVTVDISNLTDNNNLILAALLKSDSTRKYWGNTELYELSFNGGYYNITLAQSIYRRKRTSTNFLGAYDKFRYEVVGDFIGSGKYGNVKKILATIALKDGEGAIVKFKQEGKRRAVKIFSGYMSAEAMSLEYNAACLVDELHAKPITLARSGQGFFTQRYFRGVELRDYLKNNTLSLDECMKITEQVLNAYERQVRSKGLYHRDLKSENIIIQENPLKCTIIDFGFACRREGAQFKLIGTAPCLEPLAFIDPEIKESEGREIFALGRLFQEIWASDETLCGQEYPPYYKNIMIDILKLRKLYKYGKDSIDFSNVPRLNAKQQELIEAFILPWIAINPAVRVSFDEGVKQFEQFKQALDTSFTKRLRIN
jgi:serine/threonine protein kinase